MAELNATALLNDANIVSYYRLEGNSTDEKGANNGTDTSISYSTGDGRFGQGAGFNAATDQIELANEANFDRERDQTFSITGWIKTTTFTTKKYIFSKHDGATTFRGYGLFHNGADGFTFELINDSGLSQGISVATNATFTTSGAWYHVVATYSGSGAASGCKIYVNGADQALTANLDALGANTILNNATAKIGIGPGEGTVTKSIDDVAFFNDVLTATEVATLFNDGRFLSTNRGYW